jgi:hypothetical protein
METTTAYRMKKQRPAAAAPAPLLLVACKVQGTQKGSTTWTTA